MGQPSFAVKSKYDKRIWKELREALLKKFGESCRKCGFSDKRALHIDHVHGNGQKDRNRFSYQKAYYKFLLNEGSTNDYQTLCANCNMIKRFENNEFRGRRGA